MVEIFFEDSFQKRCSKLKNDSIKIKIKKQIQKISDNPEVGKPMRYERKGTREVYVNPFRLAYAYLPNEDKIIFLDLYHKDEQ
jgi:mRNA-degrading endonuclease RelE of RelBE toxin-antitoxin system